MGPDPAAATHLLKLLGPLHPPPCLSRRSLLPGLRHRPLLARP
jgi:hypothetical protein